MANGRKATWPPSPHLLCLLFLLFLLSLPSLFCRPPPAATLRCIRCIRIPLSFSSIKLAFSAANPCQPVLSVPAGDQRLVCCGGAHFQRAQLLIFLSISITRDHPFSCSTLLLQALSLDLDLDLSISIFPLFSFHFSLFPLLSFHFSLSTFLFPLSLPLFSLHFLLLTLSLSLFSLSLSLSLLFRLDRRRSNGIWRIWN